MTVEADSITFEMQLDGVNWTDVSADVLTSQPVRGSYGIMGNGPLDRVASIGTLTFTLNNSAGNSAGLPGYYSPGHTNARSGFNAGLQVRLKITYARETYIKFVGRIPPNGITVDPGTRGSRRTQVRVNDWMMQAIQHDLNLPAPATNQRLDEIAALIVANMVVSPADTQYETGIETFATVFDSVQPGTRAITEIAKAVRSEYGMAYIQRDQTTGEVLTFESRHTRADVTDLHLIADAILDETGDEILDETGDPIYAEICENASFDNTMLDLKPAHGRHIYNRVKAITYPREVDAAATTVLFTLQRAISLNPYESRDLRVLFRDPDAAATRVTIQDPVDPLVPGTDYSANAQEDGMGADLTSSLSVVAAFGTDAVVLTLTNTGAQELWIPQGELQVRGKGVYMYDPVESLEEDTSSQASYGGVYTLSYSMDYQDNPLSGQAFAEVILSRHKTPQASVERVQYSANRNTLHMLAFLQIEPGDRIEIIEDQSGIDAEFFVNGVEYEIIDGKYIQYSFIPTVADNALYWILDTSQLDVDTYLGF